MDDVSGVGGHGEDNDNALEGSVTEEDPPENMFGDDDEEEEEEMAAPAADKPDDDRVDNQESEPVQEEFQSQEQVATCAPQKKELGRFGRTR
jgi:hypothetical protein